MEETENDWLDRQYQGIRQDDEKKQKLFKDLIHGFKNLKDQLHQEKMDHEREISFNRHMQTRGKQLEDQIRQLKAMNQRGSFVLALIDGDGMIFDDQLIQRGESGGKEAANRLGNEIREYCSQYNENLAPDYRIVVRVYANLKGLADVCYRTGIIESQHILEGFVRGFTGSKALFDFVDVGSGKDRADEKITEMFKLNFVDTHCKQIIFGCSHDNGYARLLDEVVAEANCDKVTLLEGVPFERELAAYRPKFKHTHFDDLFRASKIPSPRLKQPYPASSQHAVTGMYPGMSSGIAGGAPLTSPLQHHANFNSPLATTNGYTNGAMDGMSPQQTVNGNAHRVPIEAVNGSLNGALGGTTNGAVNGSANGAYHNPSQVTSPAAVHDAPLARSGSNGPMAASWAAKASTPAPPTAPSPAPAKAAAQPTVKRNRVGQRIDDHQIFDREAVKQLQSLKLCNVHFLRHECNYESGCAYNHNYRPTKHEHDMLVQIARTVPCRMGTSCDDPKCFNGHRCPWGNDPKSKVCTRYPDKCRFAEQGMHGIDENTVRMTKVS